MSGIVGYRPYRVLLDTVGIPVFTFTSTRQLISVVWDAIEGHYKAYQAGILHGDAGVWNILIGPDGCGLMIDWDLANKLSDLAKSGQHKYRIGTGQFASAAMLMKPRTHRHVLAEDLESFLHVITWLALRFSKSDLAGDALEQRLYQLYGGRSWCQGNYDVGGDGRVSAMMQRPSFKNVFATPILNTLTDNLNDVFAVCYKATPRTGDLASSLVLFPVSSAFLEEKRQVRAARLA
ncbi:hypothetical protein BV25DRAFT_1916357 [Artomyces pyxidatus]|uniref:Uncharacterized protein n=1 Tax=Artomyces pyxidatus TaxID=48021 RepID=A0ACB8T1S0_9AGAM|nr:hypothetical protein BV25DRAFT_1916357 [Artomyces pyxidatus]